MAKYQKGKLFSEGKTKRLYQVEGDDRLLIVESKDDITKNDDPSATRQMPGKGKFATAVACAVFELLKKAGIPVAYESQISETEFLIPKCKMIPLEVIVRRYAVGSCLKRYPNLKKNEGEVPHRFHRLVFELDLKTTGGKITNWKGEDCGITPCDPDNNGKRIDDPVIPDPYNEVWNIKAKYPSWDKRSDLINRSLSQGDFLPDKEMPRRVLIEKIEELTRKTFLVLEGAWAQLGLRLIDFKIEFGIDQKGNLLVSDVVDNDSWRLCTPEWKELSKENFRKNAPDEEILKGYVKVTELVKKLTIPKQALVIWRGSKNDIIPQTPELPSINVVNVVCSGHKSTGACLTRLEEILTDYPEGGVILAMVGMSNGLGPILSARTSWPVIGVVLTSNTHPEDIASSLRLPSSVPMVTILTPKNAYLAALNILALKNPIAYMHRQYKIEELDHE